MKRGMQICCGLLMSAVFSGLFTTQSAADDNLQAKLADWRNGVWISGEGTYTIYTGTHYFVLSFEGDTAKPNLYFGGSQVVYTEKGMARKQVLRFRQFGEGNLTMFKEAVLQSDHTEKPLVIDTALFVPGTCTIKDGVIYDAITEVTDEYILLSSCNGDMIKIFSDGRSAYLPAGGGEYFSYRVEKLK